MKRIEFVIAVLLLCMIGCKPKLDYSYTSDDFEFEKLSEGVYACIHKFGGKAICNVGVIDNGEETFIFDSFLSPNVAKQLVDLVEKLGLSPIKYVINSHSHNDHIRGNQVFSNEVKIISTTKTAELIKKWEPLDIEEEKKYAPQRFQHFDSLYQTFEGDTNSREYLKIQMWRPYYEILSESHEQIKTRLPDLFVDEFQEFNGSKRRIQLISKGAGHTASDLVLYLPDDEILFSGDLVFNECHPYLAHGSLPGWKSWLNYLSSLKLTKVIPGHGQIGSKEIIETMNSYILSMENLASQLKNEGLELDDLKDTQIPYPYKDWWFDRFFESNLAFVFNSQTSN
jgi:glyoxylase-like metal-dependent hydrolase (beta-lactamase superfamily II)